MTIPGENWWDGYDLTKVDVSNNEIPSIPEDLGQQQVSFTEIIIFDFCFPVHPTFKCERE